MATEVPRVWWLIALQGAVAVVYGIAALAWPVVSFDVLVILFGVFALLYGVAAAVDVLGHWHEFDYPALRLLDGIAGIGAGLFATAWPQLTSVALLYAIAGWALVVGAAQLLDGLVGGYVPATRWALSINGVLALAFGGGLLALGLRAGPVALIWFIGIHAVLAGIAILTVALQVRRDALDRLARV